MQNIVAPEKKYIPTDCPCVKPSTFPHFGHILNSRIILNAFISIRTVNKVKHLKSTFRLKMEIEEVETYS